MITVYDTHNSIHFYPICVFQIPRVEQRVQSEDAEHRYGHAQPIPPCFKPDQNSASYKVFGPWCRCRAQIPNTDAGDGKRPPMNEKQNLNWDKKLIC